MTTAQTLPLLAVSHHAWLFAHTYMLTSTAGLLVYRSLAVRHTDKIYQPIKQILSEHNPRVVVKQTIPDKDMMFGKAELEVYRFGGSVDDPIMPFAEKFLSAVGLHFERGRA